MADTIGGRIRERRIALDMTQDQLAKALGYKSRTSINKIELDGRNLTQSKIKQIADVLNTTPDWIMGWSKDMHKKATPENYEFEDYDSDLQILIDVFNNPSKRDTLISYAKYLQRSDD